ncbi:hypothetical protein BH721_01795 [Clostridium baratii]|uniref:Uncharacterized protein n=2 Tax=Clostridium TaxID=1485 RepID=A0ABP3WX15_9CLOT|nr:hypothetical protein [Clostridium baratii]AIY83459.1 putative membrane protein [Clostridium baratii str. Sullivan]AQM61494.1 hypothetical protein NPD11_512 [Clostridium baratii]KJU70619.1 hypothetical protein UC77_13860 [Clostridium baratii]MBS6006250.1 hypothetical protein [Clostridium baratii]MBS6042427.1 hypothetical protein [Clostridium baratii]
MIYLVFVNIFIVILMLILFFKATSIFKKINENKGNLEVEGKKAKKYMIASVILVPISLLLTLGMFFLAMAK